MVSPDWRHRQVTRALVRFLTRCCGAGLLLAVPALSLALLLNPGFPHPGLQSLTLFLLISLFYTLIWTVGAVLLLPLGRLLRRRLKRVEGGPRIAPALALLYCAGAFGFNVLHNRTTVSLPGSVLFVLGALLCLLAAVTLAGRPGPRRRWSPAPFLLLLVLPLFQGVPAAPSPGGL